MRLVVAVLVLGAVSACASTSGGPTVSATSTASVAVGAPSAGPATIAYGADPSQFGQLWLPDPADVPLPAVVVLVHGGFWRETYGLDLMDGLAADLVARGFAVWNIEYRRVGQPGGGYPGTLDDVAAAVDALDGIAADHPIDLADVVVVGHSAGGHLALWLAGRAALPAGAPGAEPAVVPRLAIGQGPVFDLAAGDRLGLGGGAVTAFMGGSASELPGEYTIATPAVTAGVPLAIVRGKADDIVPAEFTVTAAASAAFATDGAPLVTVVDVSGDHFDLIDPTTDAWRAVIELIER